MPPRGRRGSARGATRSTQPTLAFDSHSNRITKSSTAVSSRSDKLDRKDGAKVLEHLTTEILADVVDKAPKGIELAIRPSEKADVPVIARDANDEKAGKISEAQIKRYWKAKEDERIAPRGM